MMTATEAAEFRRAMELVNRGLDPDLEAKTLGLCARILTADAPRRRGRGTAIERDKARLDVLNLLCEYATPLPVILLVGHFMGGKALAAFFRQDKISQVEGAWWRAMIHDAAHPAASERSIAKVLAEALGGEADQYRTQVRRRRRSEEWHEAVEGARRWSNAI
jgi:hypothetical protein